MIPNVTVKVSKYTPEVNGSMNCFLIGDRALLKATIPGNQDKEVIIDSELMAHEQAPRGLCYEVIFCDGSGKFAVDAYQLFPIIDI